MLFLKGWVYKYSPVRGTIRTNNNSPASDPSLVNDIPSNLDTTKQLSKGGTGVSSGELMPIVDSTGLGSKAQQLIRGIVVKFSIA